ncbi:Rop family plasmid primer RNA-binding protein [Salmonella enterica subsp. enterica]|nr:Rop family plasmid primer RNA-binding protein [Salmonella enterica subsp. enterica]
MTRTGRKALSETPGKTRVRHSAVALDKFIRTQTLLLLEKIDQLDLDDGATECEKLHEQAEKLYQKLLAKLESGIAP